MLYFQIISQDTFGDSFTDELSTNLPFDILGLTIGKILPQDEIFPERKIIKIISDDDEMSKKLLSFARQKRRKNG